MWEILQMCAYIYHQLSISFPHIGVLIAHLLIVGAVHSSTRWWSRDCRALRRSNAGQNSKR
jgi:hypothetical protein